MKVFLKSLSFEWDSGNISKSLEKHLISPNIAEEPFGDKNLLTFPDPTHSQAENRYHLIGKTTLNDTLFITYTLREDKIRIISARVANKKERRFYENQKV
jgi:uncharacterized DUF497 family protein